MPTPAKFPKRFCSYCGKDRSVKLFRDENDICNSCLVFDKSAQITAPIPSASQLDSYQESQAQ